MLVIAIGLKEVLGPRLSSWGLDLKRRRARVDDVTGEQRESCWGVSSAFLCHQVAVAVLPLNVAYSVLGRWLFGAVTCKVIIFIISYNTIIRILHFVYKKVFTNNKVD